MADEAGVRALYFSILAAWNRRDAAGMAGLFTDDGTVVGFDGSQNTGRGEIESTQRMIFEHHMTGRYVGIFRDARFLSDDVALARMVAGVVPDGQDDINPEINSVQSLVAVRQEGRWLAAHYHNTPAAYHGQPELAAALTAELREALAQGS